MSNNLGFSADSVLKLSTADIYILIDIFIKFPKNENLSHSSTDCLV